MSDLMSDAISLIRRLRHPMSDLMSDAISLISRLMSRIMTQEPN
jgi:hypothetical protein